MCRADGIKKLRDTDPCGSVASKRMRKGDVCEIGFSTKQRVIDMCDTVAEKRRKR